MNIADEIKQSFKKGNILTKLIYLNLAVFLIVNIISVLYFLMNKNISVQNPVTPWLAVPADINVLLSRPWTIITYMFLHEGFLHILFNIVWLWFFGRIFLEYLDEKKLIGVYFLGGIFGALLYIISFNIFPVFEQVIGISVALGASASVIAVVIAISVYVPNYTINLMFIGPVKLKYIALFSIILDVVSIASTNAGGHIAHLGGAIFGWLYISQYRRGKDITKGLNNFLIGIFKWKNTRKKTKMHVKHSQPKSDMEYMADKAKNQAAIDKVLEKISRSGYDSLTKSEKETLFKESGKK